MSLPADDEYPVLNELPAVAPLPARTTLYGLEPLGIGTGARESLTSYCERLADAHCLSPRFLAEVPPLEAVYQERFRDGALLYERCFNGGGATSVQWAALFAQLTGHSGLEALTLAPVAQIVNQRNLTSRTRRCCPQCLQEAESAGAPYAQLLWEIACVSACPIHQLELSGQCPCSPALNQQHRARRSPGRCPRCGQLLSAILPRRTAQTREVRIARLAYDLLADSRFEQGGWHPCDDRSGQFLSCVAVIHFGSNAARLAKSLGASKSSLHEWMAGKHRPTLTWLVALAECFGCSVTDVLDARAQTTHPPDGPIVRPRRASPLSVTARKRALIAERVAVALSDSLPAPLSLLARQLCVNADFLRTHFPAESAAIVSRFKTHQREQRLARHRAFLGALREKVQQLLRQGIWPTSQRVLKGIPLPARYVVFRPEINKMLAQARQQIITARP